MSARPARRLPDGFAARLRPDVRRTGDVLVGGTPLRVTRLSATAHARVRPDGVVVSDEVSAALAAHLVDAGLADPVPAGAPPAPAAVTVVVPVRDRPTQLDRCLSALAPLTCVVVDDASRDAAAVAAVAARHGATLLTLTTNLGPAGAREAGLARVRTPLVALVDSDVTVTAADLLALGRHLDDRAVVMVAPRVTGLARTARPRWFERYDAACSSLDLGPSAAPVRPGSRVAWLPAACLLARTDALRDAGGFDHQLRAGEDVDLVWRLVAAGHQVRYDPAVRAQHDTRGSARGWLARKVLYGSSGAALAARHGDAVAPAVLGPVPALGAAALLTRRRWSLPVAVLAAAVSARSVRARLPAETPHRDRLASRLAVRGLAAATTQEASLLLRSWWPLAALACGTGRSARRALATAVAVDSVVALRQRRPVDPVTQVLGRRLDDAAYGAGLWLGALRARDGRCLLPRRV